jgi:hypothetical protein
MLTKHTYLRISIVVLLVALFTSNSIASDSDSTFKKKGIIISYWGTMSNNPGLKLGLEKTNLQSDKYTVNSSISLLLNRKPDLYSSAGIVLSSSLRKTGKRAFYFEHGLNFGYLGSYYDFDFYQTNGDGEIINVGRKWFSSLILGYSLGLGYDFSKKTKTNLQIFIKPGIYYRSPNNYNIFYQNNYNTEIGLTFAR